MLEYFNDFAKNYEYLIKALGAFVPILLTICMAYIAYQQWFILKRDSSFQICKESQEKCYKPLKKYLGAIIHTFGQPAKQKAKAHKLREKNIDNIKNLFKEYPYVVNEFNDEIIKYSFDELCKIYEKKSDKLIVKNSWGIYKRAVNWFLNLCVEDNCRINLYPNRFPNIYELLRYVLKCLYQFLLPNFFKNFILEIYSTIGIYFWLWLFVAHMFIESAKEIFSKPLKKQRKTKIKSKKRSIKNNAK